MSTDEDGIPRFSRKQDRLFPRVEDWVVEVPTTSVQRAEFMMRGYRRAADELVEKALADPALKPVLVYPAIYCYRQFIELSLKNQIEKFGDIAGLSYRKVRRSHDLKKLLSHYLKLDKNRATNALTQPDMLYFIGRVKEFHRIDPQSFTFRYPDSQEIKSGFMSTNKIDLVNLRDVMDGIANLLEVGESELGTIFCEED